MSNLEYGDLSVILTDDKIISEIKEQVKIYLNSYALHIDKWYDVTGDLLYEVICILKANNVYDVVDYRIAALKEIIEYAIKDLIELDNKKDITLLRLFVSGLIDCFAKKKLSDSSETDFAPCYEDFDSTVIDVLIAINSYYLKDDWYEWDMRSNKYKVLLDAMIVNFLIQVKELMDENTTIEQLCLSFFSTQFTFSVQHFAYEQYSEEFYKICVE